MTITDNEIPTIKGMKYVPYLTGAEIMQFNRDNRRKHLGMFWTWRDWQYLAINPYLWTRDEEKNLNIKTVNPHTWKDAER